MSHVKEAYSVHHHHYTLYKSAELLIKHAANDSRQRGLYLRSAYVMLAFALEAYINDFCATSIPESLWPQMKKKFGTKEKLQMVIEHCLIAIDFSLRPFQDFKMLFDIRNELAHSGRSVTIVEADALNRIDFAKEKDRLESMFQDVPLASRLLESVFQMVDHLHLHRTNRDSDGHPFVVGANSFFVSVVLTPDGSAIPT